MTADRRSGPDARTAMDRRIDKELAALYLATAMQECGFVYQVNDAANILDYIEGDNGAVLCRTPAAPSEPAPLDVERLAAAMRRANPHMRSYGGENCYCPQDPKTDGTRCNGHDTNDAEAARIATEYARLQSTPTP